MPTFSHSGDSGRTGDIFERTGVQSHDLDDTLVRSVANAMRQHVLLIIAITVLVTTMAGAFAMSRAPHYTSSARVLVRPLPGNALSSDSIASSQQITVAMETEAGLVNSPAVTKLVAKRLNQTVNP